MGLLKRLAARVAGLPPGLATGASKVSPIEEAAQQVYGKESKLQVLREAVLAEDLRALAAEDRAKVKMMENRNVWKRPLTTGVKSGDEMGDIIVGDDITINRPPEYRPLRWLPWVAAGLVGGAGLVGPLLLQKLFKPTPPVAQDVNSPSTTIEKTVKGFLLELVE